MSLVLEYSKEIISAGISIVSWVLQKKWKAKTKLILSKRHEFTFLIQPPDPIPAVVVTPGEVVPPQQPPQEPVRTIHTDSTLIQNMGSETATKVEVVFNFKPPFINVWPLRHYSVFEEKDNRYVIIFDSLAPDEHVTFELLSIDKQCPALMTVRSDQGVAKFVNTAPQRVMPMWFNNSCLILVCIGLGAVVYGAILLTQFLVLRTPSP